MMSRRWTWISLFFLSLALAGCATSKPVSKEAPDASAAPAAVKELSADWASLQIAPGYVLVNNVWNKDAADGPYKQSIFLESGPNPAFGWTWQWPSAHGPVVSYPEVIYADKPWDAPRPPMPGFPFKAGTKRMVVDYDISLEATGVYDLAFEFWPTNDFPGKKENIAGEVMVWIAKGGDKFFPTGVVVGTLDVSGHTFDIYVNKEHTDASGVNSEKWLYMALQSREPILKGPLDFGVIIDYLLEKKMMTKDQWIIGLELGNEVQTGKGKCTVRNYKVTVD